MNYNLPQGIDLSQITADYIRNVRNKIYEQTIRWLIGLEKPLGLLTEDLFILVPYSDEIGSIKSVGQPHIMFRGGTGIGKTDGSKSLAKSIKANFKVIQGTPDLLPYDILGGQVMIENAKGERRVQFKPGPIFNHIILIDEGNRMPPRTKSALIQAMEERAISPKSDYIDDSEQVMPTLPLFPLSGDYNDIKSPRFFMVLLTENIFGEEEGSYPNPMAELDRITLTIPIDRPTLEEEKKIRAATVIGKKIEQVTDLQEVLACAHWINMHVETSSMASDYLTRLLRNTDPNPKVTDPNTLLGKFLKENVAVGASPRVNFHLEAAARVRSFFDGSMEVRPEHVKEVAGNVIVHRLVLAPGKEYTTTKEIVFEEILAMTEQPKWR
ncbi:MAG: MoxR family ATPase [Candidatus Yanofskybacteria bacterium]|nr:MoxR family ATPase [Candidatus Yanofskybacteria bacterium]